MCWAQAQEIVTLTGWGFSVDGPQIVAAFAPTRLRFWWFCFYFGLKRLKNSTVPNYCLFVRFHSSKPENLLHITFLGSHKFLSYFTNWNILPPLSRKKKSYPQSCVVLVRTLNASNDREKVFSASQKSTKEYELLLFSSCSWSFAIFHIVVKFQFPSRRKSSSYFMSKNFFFTARRIQCF